jgi:hypothetical protein
VSERNAAILRARADRVRSGVDATLDLVNALSAQAPSAEAAARFRQDAFALVAALDRSARLLDATAGLIARDARGDRFL